VPLKTAAAVAAEVLRSQPGIAYAFTNDDFTAEPSIGELVRNSVYEPRSGDVYVIAEPESAIVEGLGVYTAYHGTPYAADRYVPLYFFGAGVPAERIDRNVSTRSLAPTLAAVLGVPAPSFAAAPVLVEVAGGVEVEATAAPSVRDSAPRLQRQSSRSQASSRGAAGR
jgi:hypothetical protein